MLAYSPAIPAITFTDAIAGIRVRREGKGGGALLVRDERARSYDTYLVVINGRGVVGRVACADGDWFAEDGIFRNWDYGRGIWTVFPSSKVETLWGFATMEDAVAELVIRYIF